MPLCLLIAKESTAPHPLAPTSGLYCFRVLWSPSLSVSSPTSPLLSSAPPARRDARSFSPDHPLGLRKRASPLGLPGRGSESLGLTRCMDAPCRFPALSVPPPRLATRLLVSQRLARRVTASPRLLGCMLVVSTHPFMRILQRWYIPYVGKAPQANILFPTNFLFWAVDETPSSSNPTCALAPAGTSWLGPWASLPFCNKYPQTE